MTSARWKWLALILAATALLAATAHAQEGLEAQKGNGGWLIYTASTGGNLPDYLHTNTLTEQHLSYLVNRLAKIDADFRRRGEVFLWAIAPNAPTIYPEAMPGRYKPVGPTSKLEQLNAAFAAKGLSAFVDLSHALADEKSKSSTVLYRKTDTHWNDVGAFVGYREIMRRMADSAPAFRKQLEPMSRDAFILSVRKGYSGDLAGMMGLKGDVTEDLPELKAKSPRTAALESAVHQALSNAMVTVRVPGPPVRIETVRRGVVAVNNAARCPGPSLVMYHDSYGIRLAEWIVEHFCEATFYYPMENPTTATFDRAMLLQTKPTFFLLESVERFDTEPAVTNILDELFALEPGVAKPSGAR